LQHVLTLYKDIEEHRYAQITEPWDNSSYVSSFNKRSRAHDSWNSRILHQGEHPVPTSFASIPADVTPEPLLLENAFQLPTRQTHAQVEDKNKHEQLGHLDASEDQEDLRCTYPGCPYTGTFKRKYELQRHEKKHNQLEQQQCLGMGCDKKFYRLDKLWDHIRASRHTVFKCPVVDCPMNSSSLQGVLEHFSGHPDTVKNEYRPAFCLEYIQEHINELPGYPSEPVQSNSTPFMITDHSESALSFKLTPDENGLRPMLSEYGPSSGARSSTTSVADISVNGERYACQELDCNKTFQTKRGLG
jgi:hypothetical protein